MNLINDNITLGKTPNKVLRVKKSLQKGKKDFKKVLVIKDKTKVKNKIENLLNLCKGTNNE